MQQMRDFRVWLPFIGVSAAAAAAYYSWCFFQSKEDYEEPELTFHPLRPQAHADCSVISNTSVGRTGPRGNRGKGEGGEDEDDDMVFADDDAEWESDDSDSDAPNRHRDDYECDEFGEELWSPNLYPGSGLAGLSGLLEANSGSGTGAGNSGLSEPLFQELCRRYLAGEPLEGAQAAVDELKIGEEGGGEADDDGNQEEGGEHEGGYIERPRISVRACRGHAPRMRFVVRRKYRAPPLPPQFVMPPPPPRATNAREAGVIRDVD